MRAVFVPNLANLPVAFGRKVLHPEFGVGHAIRPRVSTPRMCVAVHFGPLRRVIQVPRDTLSVETVVSA